MEEPEDDVMDKKPNEKISKAGRKPVYTEERARIGFRCNLSLQNDLNELIHLYKEKGILIKGCEEMPRLVKIKSQLKQNKNKAFLDEKNQAI